MRWWRIKRRDADLDRELESDLELEEEEQRERGLSGEEAHYAARRAFGNTTLIREQTRSVWFGAWIESFMRDLRFGFRGMRRNAGSSVFAILIVGLGIGGASTVFSVVDALLLRPLPFREPGQLVWISNGETNSTQTEHYLDLRDHNRSFADLAGWVEASTGNLELTGTGEPERITAVSVTDNLFALLGVEPAIGRSFTKEECERKYHAPPAVVLSNSFWRRRFALDPNVVGRALTLNGKPVTVVGVLPASFDFASIFSPGAAVDAFIPWPFADKEKPFGNTMSVVGRLKHGATIGGAQAEFTALAKQLESQHPERNTIKPRLVPLERHVSGQVRPALVLLTCAVGVVMLIVCANVSHLQMARMAARQKEMAMRAALGAGRFRILRQILTETVVLSCCGGALGLVLTIAGAPAFAHLNAVELPLLPTIRVDGSTLAFTILAAVVSGVLFGLAPALQVSKNKLREAFQETGRESTGSRRHGWFRDGLVVSQFALACVLLVGAALLMQSFLHVLDVNLGFQPERAAALRIDPSFRISGLPQQNAFIDQVLERTRSIPGISAAGVADVLPLEGDRGWQVKAKGQVYDKVHFPPEAYIRVVTDGYFEALGVPLKSGREFTEGDRANTEPVAVVNESLARTLWPGQNAIGQIIAPADGGRRVIGIVGDVHHGGPEQISGNELYLSMRQSDDFAAMRLIVRTTLPPPSLATSIKLALRPIDPNLPVADFQTLQGLVDKVVSPRRFLLMLLSGFAGFALLLASLGIYALVSYSVHQRTREIGVRMALGASSWLVRRGVLGKTLRLALAGVAVGTVGSFLMSRWLQSLLFGTTAANPGVFSGVSLLLCLVALVAAYVPARRASHIDPMRALRTE
jgi:predicted permease